MKYLMLFSIRIYRKLIPAEKRRMCLYKETCSNYVERIVREKGFIEGLRALVFRFRNCNGSYTHWKEAELYIETKCHLLLKQDEINPLLVRSLL